MESFAKELANIERSVKEAAAQCLQYEVELSGMEADLLKALGSEDEKALRIEVSQRREVVKSAKAIMTEKVSRKAGLLKSLQTWQRGTLDLDDAEENPSRKNFSDEKNSEIFLGREMELAGYSNQIPSGLPTYGKRGIKCPRGFLLVIQTKLRAANVNPARFGIIMAGQVESVDLMGKLEAFLEKQSDWKEVKAFFTRSEIAPNIRYAKKRELMHMRRGRNESIQDFNTRLEGLVTYIYDDELPDDALIAYEDGLEEYAELQKAVSNFVATQQNLGNKVDLASVMSFAVSLTGEKFQRYTGPRVTNEGSSGMRENKSVVVKKEVAPIAKKEEARASERKPRELRCFHCKETGHKFYDCPKREKHRKEKETVATLKDDGEATITPDDWVIWIDGDSEEEKVAVVTFEGDVKENVKEEAEQSKLDRSKISSMHRIDTLNGDSNSTKLLCKVESQQEPFGKASGDANSKPSSDFYAPCLVNGKRVMALVDSGAQITIVSKELVDLLKIPIVPLKGTATSAFGSKAEKIGKVTLSVKWGKEVLSLEATVMNLGKTIGDLIVGTDNFKLLGILVTGLPCRWPDERSPDEDHVDISESQISWLKVSRSEVIPDEEADQVKEALEPYLSENRQMPETSFCTHPQARLVIDTGNCAPIWCAQYPLNSISQAAVDKRVEGWLKNGWIKECEPTNPWSFPVLGVPKKNSSGEVVDTRICIDLRRLNTILRNECDYTIPNIRDILMKLGPCKYFSQWDMADGYHQWLLDEETAHKVAFYWKGKHYHFVRCCFGIKPMTSYFQRVADQLIKDIDGVFAYVDDIIVTGNTLDELIERNIKLLKRFNEFKLRLRSEKCTLVANEVRYLGRLISGNGYIADPVKVKEILEWTKPKTYESLRSFVCLANYIRDHIRNFAWIAAPLHAVMMKKGKVIWTDELNQAYDNIIQALQSEQVILTYPAMDKVFDLYVDASLVGIGAVLMQDTKVIAMVSKALNSAQRNYSATKREMNAVVWSLMKFERLLSCVRFVLHTDHQALTFLLTQRHVSPMMYRWIELVCSFDFVVKHVPGKENVIADALSRQYEKWKVGKTYAADLAGVSEVVAALHDSPEERALLAERGLSRVEASEREKIIEEVHGLGHFGIDKVMGTLLESRKLWWPTMRRDVTMALKNCEPCQRFNVIEIGYHPARAVDANEPFSVLAMDLSCSVPEATTGEKYLLVLTCLFTRFVILRSLQTKSEDEVARVLVQVFADYGLPKAIQSDNGKEFVNGVMTEITRQFGIPHRLVTEYSHQANGGVERTIRTVMSSIKKAIGGNLLEWPKFVAFAQMSINAALNCSTNSTPYALMFGRKFNWDGDRLEEITSTDEGLNLWKEKQKDLAKIVYPSVAEKSQQQKKLTNERRDKRKRIVNALDVGTVVYARNVNRASKWEPLYEGPLVVVGQDDRGAYALRGAEDKLYDRHFAMDQLKVVRGIKFKEQFVVEKILDDRMTARGKEYLVKWKNYDDDQNTWEPLAMFLDWKIINMYERAKHGRIAEPGRIIKSARAGGVVRRSTRSKAKI